MATGESGSNGNGNPGGAGSGANQNARQAQMVVATLIATVSFAAGFNMPGGYIGYGKPEAGGAILLKQTPFQVFVITDILALMLSGSAVLIQLLEHMKANMGILDESSSSMQGMAFVLTFYGMLFLMAAFISGIYAVLVASRWLSITSCVIGSIIFFSYGIQLPLTFLGQRGLLGIISQILVGLLNGQRNRVG